MVDILKVPISPNFDIIKDEKIRFNDTITIKSRQLTEVYHYTREFDTNIDYKLCTVQLNIPFTSLFNCISCARILLYLDDDMICDGSFAIQNDWFLHPLNLFGHKTDLKKGHHKMKLMASAGNNAELHIPHLNFEGPEYTIKPVISGSLLIIGNN